MNEGEPKDPLKSGERMEEPDQTEEERSAEILLNLLKSKMERVAEKFMATGEKEKELAQLEQQDIDDLRVDIDMYCHYMKMLAQDLHGSLELWVQKQLRTELRPYLLGVVKACFMTKSMDTHVDYHLEGE